MSQTVREELTRRLRDRLAARNALGASDTSNELAQEIYELTAAVKAIEVLPPLPKPAERRFKPSAGKSRPGDGIYLAAGSFSVGDGWCADFDDEFMWYRVYPRTWSPHANFQGLEIVLGLDVVYTHEDPNAQILGYKDPEFFIERDPRDVGVRGGSRVDYGYVPVPVHDVEHLKAILATPASEVVRLLTPALEWAKVVPTSLANLRPDAMPHARLKKLF